MVELLEGGATRAEGQVMSSDRLSTPWREIGFAVLILALSGLFALFFRLAADGAFKIARWGVVEASPTLVLLLSTLPAELFCVLMVIARARHLNGNDYRLCLAAGPIRRSHLFALMIAVQIMAIVWYGAHELVSPEYAHSLPRRWHGPLIAAASEGPLLLVGYLFSSIILAPVSEELMFRGWLWTELSRRWGPWPTGMITSIFWLMLHFDYGVSGVFHLLPSAVALSLVRYYTGSVRATIALHMLNNARIQVLNILPFLIK